MDHVEFRQLRLRLGWSLAEMARRMGCHQSLILKWESNHQAPDPEVVRQYMSLQSFVEEQSERTRRMPLAETLLKNEHLSQCSSDEVTEWENTKTNSDDSASEDTSDEKD